MTSVIKSTVANLDKIFGVYITLTNYEVGNYYIDYYIKDYNIAVVVAENKVFNDVDEVRCLLNDEIKQCDNILYKPKCKIIQFDPLDETFCIFSLISQILDEITYSNNSIFEAQIRSTLSRKCK
jgi:predicted DNA-binding protein YlxM (UPF0122 family)